MTPKKTTSKPEEDDRLPVTSDQLPVKDPEPLTDNPGSVANDVPITGGEENEAIAAPQSVTGHCFPTDFYKSNGIPYCKACGEKHRTDLYGDPYCPIEDPECERLKR